MPRRPLDPSTAAQVGTDAHLSAHAYTTMPGPVVDGLDLDDLDVAAAAASWARARADEPECRLLASAVLEALGSRGSGRAGR